MHRNKVIDLAREAGLFSTEAPILVPKLERFAALIEAEMCKHQADKFCETHCSWTDHHVDCDQVRGDAEPAAWLHLSNEQNKKYCSQSLSFSRNRDSSLYGASVPLYINPPLAVVAQLVEALRRVMDLDCPLTGNPSHAELVEHWEYEKTQGRGEADDRLFALAALAAAKEAGL